MNNFANAKELTAEKIKGNQSVRFQILRLWCCGVKAAGSAEKRRLIDKLMKLIMYGHSFLWTQERTHTET